MPSKKKGIMVRLPDDVREWVEGQPGSAAGFIAGLVRDTYAGQTLAKNYVEAIQPPPVVKPLRRVDPGPNPISRPVVSSGVDWGGISSDLAPRPKRA